MPKPVYTIRRMEVSLLCDCPESSACADLVGLRDKNGSRESDFWGHPTFSGMPDGTVLMKLPLNVRNMSVLHECGAMPNYADDETARRVRFFRTAVRPVATTLPLMEFQREGVSWLRSRDLKGILAYDVGLGKTITSIAAMLTAPDLLLPAVVLAPAHVKLNWAGEWEKWGGDPNEIVVLFGRTPDPSAVANKRLIVLNHHILGGWVDTLIATAPRTLIVDEAHNFVNSNTVTYPLVERLARACGNRVLLLTATPLVNDLGDLWGLANLICPDILGLKGVFDDTFRPEERAKGKLLACRWRGGFAARNGWRDVAKTKLPKALMERRIAELRDLLHRTVMLRKKKSEVVTQLPAITETHLRIEIPETTKEGLAFWQIEQECESAIAEGKEDILASDKMLAAFGKAKRNAAFAKLPDAEAWVRDFLSESSEEEKLIVVGWSVEPLERLHELFKKESLLVNGSIDAVKKKAASKAFETNPKKRVLFGNIKSIGTGIDLVAARTMMFLELPLTAVDFDQVKGRIDRLSQKANALSYYYMTIRDTIEEKQGWAIIRRKQKLSGEMGL